MSLTAIARGIEGLCETLDTMPRFIAGHSAGAAIALRIALDAGAAVEAVVGLNAALLPYGGALKRIFSPLASFFASTRLMPQLLAKRAMNRRAVERVIRGTGSVLDAEGIALYQRLFSREAHLEAVLAMMAAWDLAPLTRDLPTLESRLLLVAGGRDRAVDPREADRVASRLDRAVVARLDRCGHLAHEEAPDHVARLIRMHCLEPGEGADAAD
jgi:magnesium chelatase accessory protein